MPIKSRKHSFCLKTKQGKEYFFSANDRETAEEWLGMLEAAVPNENTSPEKTTVKKSPDAADDQDVKRLDTDHRFPNTKDLFKKVRDRMTLQKTQTKKKKARKTEAIKRSPKDQLLSNSIPVEEVVVKAEPKQVVYTDFGDVSKLSNDFKTQLETIEYYLSNDELFKLEKYHNSSRIAKYQKEKPIHVIKSAKKLWIGAAVLAFLST